MNMQKLMQEAQKMQAQLQKTQKEIAKELGISRSYVSRIEKRALTKILREFIKNNQIND